MFDPNQLLPHRPGGQQAPDIPRYARRHRIALGNTRRDRRVRARIRRILRRRFPRRVLRAEYRRKGDPKV